MVEPFLKEFAPFSVTDTEGAVVSGITESVVDDELPNRSVAVNTYWKHVFVIDDSEIEEIGAADPKVPHAPALKVAVAFVRVVVAMPAPASV
jgi:hypothetical protein